MLKTSSRTASLSDPTLEMAAAVLDDLEKVLLANSNRLRQLTRSEEDKDGEIRGLGLDERHPDVARLTSIVNGLKALYDESERNLKSALRRHPLHGWVKSMRGVGEKQAARLLAAIGDPYIRPELRYEDGRVVPEGPRTVSALWAYCGYHVVPGQTSLDSQRSGAGEGGDADREVYGAQEDLVGVAPKRRKGQRSNWNTIAKTRAYLIAESCLKQLVKPCAAGEEETVHVEDCACSIFRLKYDKRRAHTKTTHPEWTPGHSHNDAMRVMAKEILKHLWRAAREHHEGKTD